MIVSIMQPYFFPYIGYFQLAACSDIFVFHDDVQYIKGGWVNRNRILRDGQPRWLTLPVRKGASRLTIQQRQYQLDEPVTARVLRRVEASYSKAPRFSAVFPLVEKLIKLANANVADFNDNLIERITAELGGRPKFIRSSELDKQSHLAGQERVVHICQRLGATHYVNPIGGTRLYDADRFARASIGLSFLEPAEITYPQFGDAPVPNLSIIDVLMFNDAERVARMLKQYQLRPGIQGRP